MNDHVVGGHPWALCTCNFAELYYRLANEILSGTNVPFDDLSRTFFDQFGVTGDEPAAAVVKALQDAGDAMLRAVNYHSDGLEVSEQLGTGSGAGCFPTLSR